MLTALGLSRLRLPFVNLLAPDEPDEPHKALTDRQLHLFSLRSSADGATVLAVASTDTPPQAALVVDGDGRVRVPLESWRTFPGGRHPFCWAKAEVRGLRPGASVLLRARAPHFATSPPATVTTAPPADATGMSLIVGSCFDGGQEAAAGLVAAYDQLVAAPPAGGARPPLHLWLDDQVYVDAPWTNGLRAADAPDVVAGKYLDAWEIGPGRDPEVRLGALLRRSSNWFLPDDHEFWNGYPELSYFTLTHHAVKRAIRQAFRKVCRPASDPHPATQGTWGRAAGEAYMIFQSPVDVDSFSEDTSPEQVQQLDLNQVRILLADTRWSRTIRRHLPGSGFMLERDLDQLIERLDTDKLVVLAVARPMLGYPPKGQKRFAIDVGAEYHTAQYTKLCRALFDRAEKGEPR